MPEKRPCAPKDTILTPGFRYSITPVPKFPDRPGRENRVHFSYASVGYAWDAAANLTSMTDPQGGATTYTWDTLNRVATLKNPQRDQFTFTYDALGRRTQLARPNSVKTNYQYDPLARVTSLLDQYTTNKGATTTLDGAQYSYDAAGNRLSKTDKLTNIVSNYTYDPLYELTAVTQGANTTESYSFDAVGNWLSSLNVPSYTYNSSNELTAQTGVTYAYDNNGNLISKTGGTTYSWDFENRLTRVILPGNAQINFKYDPMGRRIQKSSSAGTVNYIYDQTNVLEEVDTAGTLVTRYTQNLGIDEPLVTLKSGTASYYEADALGSVTTLSNSSGALAKTYSYDSFGRLLSSSGTIANPYGFSGRKLDSETGLMYYRARYYDPVVGRFIAEDPIGFKGGFNFYEYTGNNVTNAIDPMGLEWWYSQATGQVSHFDPVTGFTFVATGYAGHIHGLNNPSLQETPNIGPIPVGRYTIGAQRDNVTTNRTSLPASMRLIPDPSNWMFGRSRFLIHGGDMEKRTSSAGCIILPLEIRNLIGNSNDRILIVY